MGSIPITRSNSSPFLEAVATRMPMGRPFESKAARPRGGTARPGAARTLPLRIVAKVPVIRRLAPREASPAVPPPASRLSPRRVLQLLRRRPPPKVPVRARAIPFVSPVIRGVRRPIERTAAVVQAARDVRRPRTRWERLREAARLALEDPARATTWEHLMGLGLGLVAGRPSVEAAPKRRRAPSTRREDGDRAQPAARSGRGVRERLQALQSVLNRHAGPLGRHRRTSP